MHLQVKHLQKKKSEKRDKHNINRYFHTFLPIALETSEPTHSGQEGIEKDMSGVQKVVSVQRENFALHRLGICLGQWSVKLNFYCKESNSEYFMVCR